MTVSNRRDTQGLERLRMFRHLWWHAIVRERDENLEPHWTARWHLEEHPEKALRC